MENAVTMLCEQAALLYGKVCLAFLCDDSAQGSELSGIGTKMPGLVSD
jgi:hypothetical protein